MSISDISRIESGHLVLRREEFSLSAMLEQINLMVMSQCSDKGLSYECRILNHMDVRMPEMDGLEAAEAIRALSREDAKRIPIIALTANAFDEDVQRSMQAGMNSHLSKPVDPELLFQTLGELIYEAEENK